MQRAEGPSRHDAQPSRLKFADTDQTNPAIAEVASIAAPSTQRVNRPRPEEPNRC